VRLRGNGRSHRSEGDRPAAPGDHEGAPEGELGRGCSGCHTYAPAGSHGQIGPNLGKLAQYARQANQGPLDQFIVTSITNPGAYIQPGYQNVMPNTYANLPKKQLADLLAFLTKKK
jgi:hypothetical protein